MPSARQFVGEHPEKEICQVISMNSPSTENLRISKLENSGYEEDRDLVYIVYIMLSAFAIKTQDCAKHASTDPN
jgi:hypothetical protein